MRLGFQEHRVRALHEVPETGVARQIAAQHQGVDEAPDQLLGLEARPARHRSADAQIVLAAVAEEQRLEGRQEHGEQRRALAQGEVPDRPAQVVRQPEGTESAAERRGRGARPVERQVEVRGRARETSLPVGDLRPHPIVLQARLLPRGIVGVLDRQVGEPGRRSRDKPLVHRLQLAQQDAERPAVADDVMQGQDQDVVLPVQAQKPRPEQRSVRQVEWSSRLLRGRAERFALPRAVRQAAQVDAPHGGRLHRQDAWHRLPVLHREDGPQRLVAAGDGHEGALERVFVEPAAQAKDQRDVVGGAPGAQLIDEPQAPLGGRQRGRRAAEQAPDAVLPELRSDGRLAVDQRRQPGDGGPLEHAAHRELDLERLADAGDELQGEEGVPAGLEEVVVNPDPLTADQIDPDPRQRALRGGARQHVRGGSGDRDRSPARVARRPGCLRKPRERDRRGAPRRVGQEGLEQDLELAGHALDRAAIEQVGAVLQDRFHGAVLFRDDQRQVERRRSDLEIHRFRLQTRECRRVRRAVLQDEHRLEQRVDGGIAPGSQRLDDLLERQILPGQRLEGGSPHPPQVLRECRVARQVGAQNEGVDEDTDERLGLQTRAPGDRRPDAQIVLAREAPQKRLEGRKQHHERGGVFAPRQLLQPQGAVGRNDEPDAPAAVGRGRRARTIERQAENGRGPLKPRPPELQKPLRLVALQPESLPVREVRVLDGRFGKGRRPAA